MVKLPTRPASIGVKKHRSYQPATWQVILLGHRPAPIRAAHDEVLVRSSRPVAGVDGIDGQLRKEHVGAADEEIVYPVQAVTHRRVVGSRRPLHVVVLVKPGDPTD